LIFATKTVISSSILPSFARITSSKIKSALSQIQGALNSVSVTTDDFKALSDYANSHKVSYAGYTILTPMPGTTYYDEVKDEIIDHDLSKYNFFNCVLPTKLTLLEYYKEVGKLWLIKKGKDVI